jgi:hypothetical protein
MRRYVDVFAGRAVESSFFMQVAGSPRGIQYFLKESVLSLRALDAILTQWQNDGYKYELDHYIWNEFIGQSTQPSDRAYLYQLFRYLLVIPTKLCMKPKIRSRLI